MDKFQLRDYLETLDLANPEELSMKAEKIRLEVKKVAADYLSLPQDDALRIYYASEFLRVEEAFKSGDFREKVPEALDSLIASINWE
jgi:hypothetical protein